MVFNSYIFIVFFALMLLVRYAPVSWHLRKIGLLLGSYVFYAAWKWPYVGLLLLSTVVDWEAAKGISRNCGIKRRLWLLVSLSANLGLLAVFKYSGFCAESVVSRSGFLGLDISFTVPSLVLPVGISFYTFQTLSYSIDVYRDKMKPAKSFVDYAMYVAFFPQLVAGPIVRAVDFMPQCAVPNANPRQFLRGISLLVLGVILKVTLADALLAPCVDSVYKTGFSPSGISAWIGTMAFGAQIYCDFAGYSLCAIGCAACLGFELPRNFACPYAAESFSDFWRRWHISLSTWLRDYLYIPLGGGRRGSSRTAVNLMLTMLLGGLWHGAAWTFVIWGGIHGFMLVVERGVRHLSAPFVAKLTPSRISLLKFGGIIRTLILVQLAWIPFRAGSVAHAKQILFACIGLAPSTASSLDSYNLFVPAVATACIFGAHLMLRKTNLNDIIDRTSPVLLGLAIGLGLFVIYSSPGSGRSFIYFQF